VSEYQSASTDFSTTEIYLQKPEDFIKAGSKYSSSRILFIYLLDAVGGWKGSRGFVQSKKNKTKQNKKKLGVGRTDNSMECLNCQSPRYLSSENKLLE